MPDSYQLRNYSPAGNTPKFFYFNECGTFELAGDTGTAIYAWGPISYPNGSPRPDALSKGHHDHLEFVEWSIMEYPAPNPPDEGWIYKAQNENFWFFFSDISNPPPPASPYPYSFHKLYYSSDGETFYRFLTNSGTQRLPLHRIPVPGPSQPGATTPAPPVTPVGPAPPVTMRNMRFGLGTHNLYPKQTRVCPNPIHKSHGVDVRDHWIKAWVDVAHADIERIKKDVQDCLREAAIKAAAAALLAAIASGGGAAAGAAGDAFERTFLDCIEPKISGAIKVELGHKIETGDWSGH